MAIVIASVAFGVLISADFGMIRPSHAQQIATTTSPQGPITTMTIPSFADVAARVNPAVVSITSTEIVHTSEMNPHGFGGMDPFDFFFGPNTPRSPRGQGRGQRPTPAPNPDDETEQRAGGSGFIISPDGYILTNNHVIEGASKVQVHYGADENGSGGHTIDAKVVGRDPSTDIALLKIDAGGNLPTVPLGDSDRARKGDWAIAIGNPYQFENTLTVGVISAKGRALGLSEQTRSFENFIQTDAAINFGNSGGPLLNINGEVIGINTAIRGGGAQGIGFATPINTAKRLLPMLKTGKVTRGYLGMSITEVGENEKRAFNLPEARGALVQSVEPGKPADKAGIQHGDVVVDIDGKPIQNNRQLIDYISYLPIGSHVKIGLIRNGKSMTVEATTAERPDESTPADESVAPNAPTHNKLGLSLMDLTPALRQQYSLPDNVTGVLVTGVRDVSPAGEAGFSEGDVITELQGQKITSLDQFRRQLDTFKSGQWIRMYVSTPTRGGTLFSSYRALQIP